jgi:hypothetical protein
MIAIFVFCPSPLLQSFSVIIGVYLFFLGRNSGFKTEPTLFAGNTLITAVFLVNDDDSLTKPNSLRYCKIGRYVFCLLNTAKILLQGICFCKRHICLHLVGLFSGLIALWYLPELQGTLLELSKLYNRSRKFGFRQ